MLNTPTKNMEISVEAKVLAAEKAFQKWKKVPFKDRQILLKKLTKILNNNSEKFGRIITKEMNKPVSQSIAEVQKCALMTDFYANAKNILKPEILKNEFSVCEIYHQPLGIVMGVMPWNFPFWQALRFAIPTILAGNVVVLKHASICQKSGDMLEKIFIEAGFPKGIFTHLKVSHDEVEALLSHPLIKAVSLTGSEGAGSSVASAAGKNIKKSLLELGGNDAFIVLDDANLDKAAESAALGRLQNCGQTCVASKRFIIHSKVYDVFLEKFIKEFKKYKVGNPLKKETKISGMARPDLSQDLEKQYKKALKNGAEIIIPLKRLSDIAFEPGLLKMNPGNPILNEELFGPLGMVLKAKNDEEILKIANDTKFGLANSIWSKDKKRLQYFAENLQSGTVSVNQITKSDPRFPFGGTKSSGYGSELSLNALKEFTTMKTVIGNL